MDENNKKVSPETREEWKKNLPVGVRAEDVAMITRIEWPLEGGTFTYLKDFKYPYKGFPEYKIVNTLAIVKKAIPSMMALIKKPSIRRVFKFALIGLITKKARLELFEDLADAYITFCYSNLKPYFPVYKRYCIAVREIYIAISRVVDKMPYNSRRELLEKAREVICILLEYDNAYRYRLQDGFAEINKQKLMENPAKELDRILGIVESRERYVKANVKNGGERGMGCLPKIQSIRKMLKMFFKFIPDYGDIFKEILSQVDFEKIKLDDADQYFCLTRDDYDFWGEPFYQRINKRMEMDKEIKSGRIQDLEIIKNRFKH